MTYTNWFDDDVDTRHWEPNSLDSQCVVMDPSRRYKWADSECSQLYSFFCQKG